MGLRDYGTMGHGRSTDRLLDLGLLKSRRWEYPEYFGNGDALDSSRKSAITRPFQGWIPELIVELSDPEAV